MIFVISWEAIGFIIVVLLMVLGGSSEIFGFVSFMLILSQILIVIFGIICIISCLGSPGSVPIIIFRILLIILISAIIFWFTNVFRNELIDSFHNHFFEYLANLLFGLFIQAIYVCSGEYLVTSLALGEVDESESLVIALIAFIAIFFWTTPNILSTYFM